jgi:hypothetical protein
MIRGDTTRVPHFAHDPSGDSIYHPTLVGPDFFHKTGGVL